MIPRDSYWQAQSMEGLRLHEIPGGSDFQENLDARYGVFVDELTSHD